MKIDKKLYDSCVLLSLDGNLFGGPKSVELCTAFHELIRDNKNNLVLDISRLSWMSIAGTGLLISALTSFRNQGGDIKLVGALPDVKDQLEKASFDVIFSQYDHVEAAVAAY